MIKQLKFESLALHTRKKVQCYKINWVSFILNKKSIECPKAKLLIIVCKGSWSKGKYDTSEKRVFRFSVALRLLPWNRCVNLENRGFSFRTFFFFYAFLCVPYHSNFSIVIVIPDVFNNAVRYRERLLW